MDVIMTPKTSSLTVYANLHVLVRNAGMMDAEARVVNVEKVNSATKIQNVSFAHAPERYVVMMDAENPVGSVQRVNIVPTTDSART